MLLPPLGAAAPSAYCIHNQLRDRDVFVEQEQHPDTLRDDRALRVAAQAGRRATAASSTPRLQPRRAQRISVVTSCVTVPGRARLRVRRPEGAETDVKVTGAGTMRMHAQPAARRSARPYIVRIRTHDSKDLTGPRGVACPEPEPKGKP